MSETANALARGRAIIIDLLDRAVEAVAEKDAEIARLKAELDERHEHNVVHFQENVNHPTWRATDPAISELIKVMYADEPDGTIMRATDTGREWVKENGEWVRQP